MASGVDLESEASPPGLHVLVDTNVVLDLLLARQPWLSDAEPMWEARDAGHFLRICLPRF